MTIDSRSNPSGQGRLDDDAKVALLKHTMPFQVVSEQILRRIASIASEESLPRDQVLYKQGDKAQDLFVVVSGRIQHALGPEAEATRLVKQVGTGEVIGWAALLKNQPRRLATTTAQEDTRVLRINADELLSAFNDDRETGDVVMSRFATMIKNDYTLPDWLAKTRRLSGGSGPRRPEAEGDVSSSNMALTMYRLGLWIKSPRPYLMLTGFAIFLAFWHFSVAVFEWPRFRNMPGLFEVLEEWTSRDPIYGLSFFTPDYYIHIMVSVRRVFFAFLLATGLGVTLGLFMGWSKTFREFVFPVFETLRPIPILAWVPLAIIMFYAAESTVIFLTFLASFYATALNTMLGVDSIDESYSRAAYCLGANRWQEFRHVIIPGALPFIFTGLQISVGVAWFSLVAAEMVSGEFGLGYVINTSFTTVKYPTIIIGMITLGVVGYTTSAMVRVLGDYLMQWRVRELAMGGR
jgi:NitT/TauT family transport system permease protein